MATPADPADAQRLRHVLVQAAGTVMAIPSADVLRVLPPTVRPAPLPRAGAVLAGVVRHNGQVVPVVDLARWGSLQGAPAGAGGEGPLVLVLREQNRLIGLAIDRVQGMVTLAPGAIQQVHHDNPGKELFHSVACVPGCEQPVPVLDALRLQQQTRVWAAQEPGLADAQESEAGSATGEGAESADSAAAAALRGPAHAVVELGNLLWALPVDAVGTLMPTPVLKPLRGIAAELQGLVPWQGRDIPVVQLHALLGLPVPAAGAALPPWLMVVSTATQALGILVDRFVAVQGFAPRQVQTRDLEHYPHAHLYTGIATGASGQGERQVRLLCAQALLQRLAVSAIGGAQGVAAATRAGAGAGPRDAYIMFSAGRLMAAPLRGVREILPHAGLGAEGAVERHLPWRGQLVPLHDLRQRPVRSASARILMASDGEQPAIGLLVDAVLDLVPPHVGELTRLRLNDGRHLTMLTTQVQGVPGSYEVVDLHQLARKRPQADGAVADGA